jgi:hypothetical protein
MARRKNYRIENNEAKLVAMRRSLSRIMNAPLLRHGQYIIDGAHAQREVL